MTEQEVRKRERIHTYMAINAGLAKSIENSLDRNAPMVLGSRWAMADLECMGNLLLDMYARLQNAGVIMQEFEQKIGIHTQ